LTSILFSTNISACRIPDLRLEGNSLLLVHVLLRAGVLDIEEIPKRPEDHDEGDKVKGPGGCVDELVSPQQQLGFNTVEIFTSDE
jgi:hypothetical protein